MSYQYNLNGLGLLLTIPLNHAESGRHSWVDYAVSSNIKEEQKYGIAYGMFMDFERGYVKRLRVVVSMDLHYATFSGNAIIARSQRRNRLSLREVSLTPPSYICW